MSIEPITRKERILSGEDIEPITRFEYFMKEAVGGCGSGSGLPPYTYADKGKFLGLGDSGESETVVIVPEQTGECVDISGYVGFDVVNADLDYFADIAVGDTCSLKINGVDKTMEATDQYLMGSIAFVSADRSYALVPFYVDDTITSVVFGSSSASVGDEVTISATASAPKVEPKWAGILYQFEVGKTTPQDIINAAKEGKLVVMGTQAAAYGWDQGLSILMVQFEYSTGTYGVRFIGINSGGNGVSVKGDNLEADGLNSAYEVGST